MNAAFVASGLLIAIGAVGVFRAIPGLSSRARTTYTAIFALAGLGLVIDGLFTLEQIMAHTLGFGLGIGALVVGYFLAGRALRRMPAWRGAGTLALVASGLTIGLTVVFFATFSPTPEGATTGIAGLTERILVVEALLPIAVLGWLTYARGGTRRN